MSNAASLRDCCFTPTKAPNMETGSFVSGFGDTVYVKA